MLRRVGLVAIVVLLAVTLAAAEEGVQKSNRKPKVQPIKEEPAKRSQRANRCTAPHDWSEEIPNLDDPRKRDRICQKCQYVLIDCHGPDLKLWHEWRMVNDPVYRNHNRAEGGNISTQ